MEDKLLPCPFLSKIEKTDICTLATEAEQLRKENEELRNKLKPHPNCDRSCMYLCESGAELLKRENKELKAKLDKVNWQPIETAPEGKNVLVWYKGGVEVAWRFGKYWQLDTKKIDSPTFWMPLPDAPEKL